MSRGAVSRIRRSVVTSISFEEHCSSVVVREIEHGLLHLGARARIHTLGRAPANCDVEKALRLGRLAEEKLISKAGRLAMAVGRPGAMLFVADEVGEGMVRVVWYDGTGTQSEAKVLDRKLATKIRQEFREDRTESFESLKLGREKVCSRAESWLSR